MNIRYFDPDDSVSAYAAYANEFFDHPVRNYICLAIGVTLLTCAAVIKVKDLYKEVKNVKVE